MQPDTIYQNAATSDNMDGVSEGLVWANAVYADGAVCAPGTYLPMLRTQCETCLENYFCEGGTFEKSDAVQGLMPCLNGGVSPAGSTNVSMCHPWNIICSAGTYLPANTRSCVVCPADSYCGGDNKPRLYADSNKDQGIASCPEGTHSLAGATAPSACVNSAPGPDTIECPEGEFVPAYGNYCQTCPENYYCGGDGESRVFDTSADVDQGIASCPEGLVSPLGAASVGECGKELHVGNDILYLTSVKQTTPALVVKMNGAVYYAKITLGAKPMNYLTHRSLRTIIDGKEYSIHDNTIREEQ
jgi:hypothetical protein